MAVPSYPELRYIYMAAFVVQYPFKLDDASRSFAVYYS